MSDLSGLVFPNGAERDAFLAEFPERRAQAVPGMYRVIGGLLMVRMETVTVYPDDGYTFCPTHGIVPTSPESPHVHP